MVYVLDPTKVFQRVCSGQWTARTAISLIVRAFKRLLELLLASTVSHNPRFIHSHLEKLPKLIQVESLARLPRDRFPASDKLDA